MKEHDRILDAFRNCITEPKCKDCPWTECEELDNRKIKIPADLALAVMRELVAQEPRVMTLIEWIRAPEPADGECMCYEIKDKGLQAMLVKAFDGVRHLYGKAFRVWTSRPTDEQMEATPALS